MPVEVASLVAAAICWAFNGGARDADDHRAAPVHAAEARGPCGLRPPPRWG